MLPVRWHSKLQLVLVTAFGKHKTQLVGHAMSSDNKQTLQHAAQHSRDNDRTQLARQSVQILSPLLGGLRPADTRPRAEGNAAA